MDYSDGPGGSGSSFCQGEIEAVGATASAPEQGLAGQGYLGQIDGGSLPTSSATSTSGFPIPTQWSPWMASTAPTGIGGHQSIAGVNSFNQQIDRVLYVRTDVSPHQIETCARSSCPTTRVAFTDPLFLTTRRPTVTYDPTRKIWYIFVVSTSQTDATNANRVQIAWSPDGTAWFPLGSLPDVVTRYSVGAAYDSYLDGFVVAWSNGRADATRFPTPNAEPAAVRRYCNTLLQQNGQSVPYAFGCEGEVNLHAIRSLPGTPLTVVGHLRLSNASPGLWGFRGLGAPVVVCDQGAYYNCEVLTINYSADHDLVGRRFCISQSSGFCGATGVISNGGTSNFPLTISPRRPDGSGALTLGATGYNREVYIKSKTSIGASWTDWSSVSTIPVASGPLVDFQNTNSYRTGAAVP